MRLLWKETLGGLDSITLEIVSPLCLTIEYRAGYYSLRDIWPSHLSSQNLIHDPSLILKEPKRRKCFLDAISLAQKYESPGFQATWDRALDPIYFLHKMVYQTPSSERSLNNHLPRSAVFLTFKSFMPSPPYSFGRQITFHLASRCFFFTSSPCQKNLERK